MNPENLKYYKKCLVKFEAEDKTNTDKKQDRVKGIKEKLKDKSINVTDKEIEDKLDKKNNLVKKKMNMIKKYIDEYDTRLAEQERQKAIDELVNEVLPDLEYPDNIDVALEKVLN